MALDSTNLKHIKLDGQLREACILAGRLRVVFLARTVPRGNGG